MNAPDPHLVLRAAQDLRAMLDGSAAGVLVQDERGHIVDANQAAERLLGLPRERLLGLATLDATGRGVDRDGQPIAPQDRPFARTLRTGQPIRDLVLGLTLPDGPQRWLKVDTSLLPRDTGAPWVVTSFVDVTEQYRLEQALRDQQHSLRASLDGSRTATWEWNVQTGEVRIDERWAQILGHTLAELQPVSIQTWFDLVHPDDLPQSNEQVLRHFKGEIDFYDIECRMRHRDGSWRWVRDRGRLSSRSADGQPLWMHGTHEDISDRKSAEQALAHHHGLMRALFELSPLGLQLVNLAQRRVEAVNDALVAITGYPRDELLHGDGRARFPPAMQPVRDRWFADAMAHGRFGPSEVDYRHQSGRIIRLVFNGVRITDPRHAGHLWLSVQDVTAQRALEEELRNAASTDRLTGLANRATLLAALQQHRADAAAGRAGGFAVMYLDFDRFKLVNDTLGHDAGDALLCAIAQRLRAAAERAAVAGAPAWTVSRFGGDEFVLLVPGLDDDAAAARVAGDLLAALGRPYPLADQAVDSSASIGIARWHPGVRSDDELLRDADSAMYEAKRSGRGRWVMIDETLRARLARTVKIEHELRHAIGRGQLQLAWQPIVDLQSGASVAVEALPHWVHPELGAVPAAEFMPVAEESRFVVELGEWLLRQACLQWAAWHAAHRGQGRAPALVSVNLSRALLSQGQRLPDLVRQALAAAAMPAAALQLELSERDLVQDPAQVRQPLRDLAAMGVKLALDDFGTGTSSLGLLREFPLHTVKLGRSCIAGLANDPMALAVVHATLNLIENLGLASVAEGLEQPSEVATLLGLGCRHGQGPLFAPPLTADAVPARVAGPGPG